VSQEIFRSFAHDLFTRLLNPKKTVIAERQLSILEKLLQIEGIELTGLINLLLDKYTSIKNPRKAIIRDLVHLVELRAIQVIQKDENQYIVSVRLEWPSEMTESEAFEIIKKLPKAKTRSFLAGSVP